MSGTGLIVESRFRYDRNVLAYMFVLKVNGTDTSRDFCTGPLFPGTEQNLPRKAFTIQHGMHGMILLLKFVNNQPTLDRSLKCAKLLYAGDSSSVLEIQDIYAVSIDCEFF